MCMNLSNLAGGANQQAQAKSDIGLGVARSALDVPLGDGVQDASRLAITARRTQLRVGVSASGQ